MILRTLSISAIGTLTLTCTRTAPEILSRTEVWRMGKLLLVERLLTESAPASSP